jgi:RNase adaptor protein for sRNA GlmZ degradation
MSKDTRHYKAVIFINFTHQILVPLYELFTQIHPIHAVNNAYSAVANNRDQLSICQIQLPTSVQNKLRKLSERFMRRKEETGISKNTEERAADNINQGK